MNTVDFNIDGKTLSVKLCDFNEERESVRDYLDRLNKCEETYHLQYERRESTKEEVESDVKSMTEMLNQIESNPSFLEPFVKEIRKKKNGLLWKNSGVVIKMMDHCCDYFTDFTNAWSTPELRLDVVDELTCKLSIRERTYTF